MSDDPQPAGDAGHDDRRRKESSWQRFLDQKTTPQRLLIALAGVVGACVTIGAGIFAATGLVGGDSGGSIDGATQERVAQGTPAADRLVKRLLAANGGRLALDQIVEAPAGTAPFEHADIRLLYNCRGRPVGDDNCTLARLQLSDDDSRQPAIVDRSAAHYKGIYAIDVTRGTIYGTELDVVIDNIAS